MMGDYFGPMPMPWHLFWALLAQVVIVGLLIALAWGVVIWFLAGCPVSEWRSKEAD